MIAEPLSETGRGRRFWLMASGAVAALLALAAGVVLWLRLRLSRQSPPAGLPLEDISGLSEEEAAARCVEGQHNDISFHPPRSRKQIIRENTFTVFNIGLVAIVFVQMMLGRYLDALMSVGVLIFTIGINVFQEEFARIRLRKIMQEARPKAYVVRDSRVRSIDPDDVVVGDALIIGPGDQTVVDGKVLAGQELVVDESLIFTKGHNVVKKVGDDIFAGSLCISGRGAYRARRIGRERLIERKLEHLAAAPETMTPIERIVNRTLQLLLAFVLAIAAFVLSKFFLTTVPWPEEFTETFIDAIGVLFSIAPAGLFFMIVLTYAGATVDLMQRGALVHRARAIETLAQTDVICFSKAGFLTSEQVEIRPVADEGSKEKSVAALTEIDIHKMLGTFARSTTMRNHFVDTLKLRYDGQQLPPTDEMPFLAVYGWSGVSLADDMMQGVLVLGEPEQLQAYIETEQKQDETKSKGLLKQVSGVGEKLGSLFGRKEKKEQPKKQDSPVVDSATQAVQTTSVMPKTIAEPAPEPAKTGSHFKRWGKSLIDRLHRGGGEEKQTDAEEKKTGETTTLLFAWLPEPHPLHDETGQPQLPAGLIPLCQLDFQKRINPDAVQALAEFYANGVMTVIFSSDPPENTLQDLRHAGVSKEIAASLKQISGEELAAMDDGDFTRAINEHHIFGEMTPEQMTRAVSTMRATGHRVGVVGAGANEIHPMLNADISLTPLTASSGALSIADIILLETSPAVTSRILDKGQRIVNGLLDVLKLYLTQALYLLILIIALLFHLKSFPYKGAQGGLIAAFAISIPAVAVTLTAPAGRLDSRHLGRHLGLFVIPAAFSIAAAGYVIFAHFYHLYNQRAEAQIGLVHGLVFIGLLLAVLIRPPIFLTTSINTLARNLLTTIVAIISGAIFLLITHIGLAQKFLQIKPLQSFADYQFVVLVSLAWAAGFGAYLLVAFGVKWLIGEKQSG